MVSAILAPFSLREGGGRRRDRRSFSLPVDRGSGAENWSDLLVGSDEILFVLNADPHAGRRSTSSLLKETREDRDPNERCFRNSLMNTRICDWRKIQVFFLEY